MIFLKAVRYKHEISLVKDARPNQEVELVRYNREFVITVIVKTEFDCTSLKSINLSHSPFLSFERGGGQKSLETICDI